MEKNSPVELVWSLINMHALARCVHIVADFGVADALEERATPVAELATATGLNADALHRILRLMAAHGIFAFESQGYVHTQASRLLRTDHPQSLRAYARMIGMPAIWRGITELAHAARTGEPETGMAGYMTYFADHPNEASLFNHAMAAKSSSIVPAVVEAYDFGGFGVIADIGGGRGHLLEAILARAVTATGVLFDLPHVIADAAAVGSDRLRLAAGDFFRDPLPAADAYLLMEVIHDWADEDAARILAAVRRTAHRGAKVLIIETLVSESPGPQVGKMLDIMMLALTGGRERTRSEYEALLRPAGFQVQQVIPTATQYSIVEAKAT